MVTVIKIKVTGTEFFYLSHSIRDGNKVINKRKYLGRVVPHNIEEIKIDFLREIYQERWFSKLDKIKKNFRAELQRMPNDIQESELENFMIKFTYNTNKIEGGTLTLRETANVLHNKITPSYKPIRDVKEAESHKEVFYKMLDFKEDLTLNIILKWHKIMFKDTKPQYAGKIRNVNVGVTGSAVVFPTYHELDFLLKDFFKWYNKNKFKLHPVELSALVHLKFVSIHPFGDGNGRISRLIMNFVLKKYDYPMLDISYKNRDPYYNALERSQIKKQDHVFVQYLIKRYIRDFKQYIDVRKKKNE
jgi:Fic family protein